MTEWLCPNITSFTLLNMPETYTNGRDFKLVVDLCVTGEPFCHSTIEEKEDFIGRVTLSSKIISQYFDAKSYQETKKLAYVRNNEMNSALIKKSCVTKAFNVYQHQLSIFDNKMYDWSSIVSQLVTSNDINAYQFNFWNTILTPYNHKQDMRYSSGIYQLVFNQNSQVFTTNLKIVTFDQVLAFIGGYIGLIYAIVGVMTAPYRDYSLDMTLIRLVYSQDGRDGRLGEEPSFTTENDLINHRFDNKREPDTMSYPIWIVLNIFTKTFICFKNRQCYKKMQ